MRSLSQLRGVLGLPVGVRLADVHDGVNIFVEGNNPLMAAPSERSGGMLPEDVLGSVLPEGLDLSLPVRSVNARKVFLGRA